MRIAIAGTGDLARYFVEELLAASYEVVVLARGPRILFARPDVSLRITNYSILSLCEALEDCDGLVSAIQDLSMKSAAVHLALLEACKQSPRCNSFIPSEYSGNIDDFPKQPLWYFENHQPVRDALLKQADVKWTLLGLGWFADYLLPPESRYIRDIGDLHPVDFTAGTMTIPGTGEEVICMIAARDVARAIAQLFKTPTWEPTTYVCGEQTTWNKVKELLIEQGHNFDISYQPKGILEKYIAHPRSRDEILVAQFGL